MKNRMFLLRCISAIRRKGRARPGSSIAQIFQALAAWALFISAVIGYFTTVVPIASKARLEEDLARVAADKKKIEIDVAALHQAVTQEQAKIDALVQKRRLEMVKNFMATLPSCAKSIVSGGMMMYLDNTLFKGKKTEYDIGKMNAGVNLEAYRRKSQVLYLRYTLFRDAYDRIFDLYTAKNLVGTGDLAVLNITDEQISEMMKQYHTQQLDSSGVRAQAATELPLIMTSKFAFDYCLFSRGHEESDQILFDEMKKSVATFFKDEFAKSEGQKLLWSRYLDGDYVAENITKEILDAPEVNEEREAIYNNHRSYKELMSDLFTHLLDDFVSAKSGHRPRLQ